MAEEMQVGVKLYADASNMLAGFRQANASAQQLQSSLSPLAKGASILGGGIAAVGLSLLAFGKKSFEAAARVSELNVAIDAIGKSTGIGAGQIHKAAEEIKSMGIEMASAQQMAIEFAKGNLDMRQASNIARAAQDLAVISQRNSTDTAMLLTRAITTGNTVLLKSAGITKQASEGYAEYARQLGKNSDQLTSTERQQAIVNLILEEGKNVAGVYEGAMQEAGKVLRSFPRLLDDIHEAFGSALLGGFGPAIKSAYDLVNAFDKAVSKGGALRPVIDELSIAFTIMLQPITDGFNALTNMIKGLDNVGGSVEGMGKKIAEYMPMVTAFSVGLSTLAGRNLLTSLNLGPLSKLAGFLKPLPITMLVLVATNEKLRASFMKIASALLPLVGAFVKLGGVVGKQLNGVIDMLATFISAISGPVAGAVNIFSSAIYGIVSVLEMIGPVLQPLIIMMGVAYANSMIMAGVATVKASLAIGEYVGKSAAMKAIFPAINNFILQMQLAMVKTPALAGQSVGAFQAFGIAAKGAFMSAKAAAMSFMASVLPMLLISVAIMGIFKLFQMHSAGQKQMKERTNDFTSAIKEQVNELKTNNKELGDYLTSTKMLSETLTGAGEDGKKLTTSLHTLGLNAGDAIDAIQKMGESTRYYSQELAQANGVSGPMADKIAVAVATYDDLESVLSGIPVEYHGIATALEELNDQQEKTDLTAYAQKTLEATAAVSKNNAEIVKNVTATTRKEYADKGLAETDAMWLEINKRVGKELAANTEKTAGQGSVVGKTNTALKAMVGRLGEVKAAQEGAAIAAVDFQKAIMGEGGLAKFNQSKGLFEMRQAFTELDKSVMDSKGNFDGLTQAGFDLGKALGENAQRMRELGKSDAEIAAASNLMVDRFMKSAKAAGFEEAQVKGLLDTLGLLDGYVSIVTIKADIAQFKTQLIAVTAALDALSKGVVDNQLRKEYQDQQAQLKGAISALDAQTKAYQELDKAMTKVQENTSGSAKEDAALTAEKEKLKKQILALVQGPLDAETKKLDELKRKLADMTSATKDAIMSVFSFADALDSAMGSTGDYAESLEDMKNGMADAMRTSLSLSDAFGEQKQALDDIAQAQLVADDANQRFNASLDAYANAQGRKNRRSAYEDLVKAADEVGVAQEDLARITNLAADAQGRQLTMIDRLKAQASSAKNFGARLQTLATMGLDQGALQQIVSAGAVAGTAMADELIAGGSQAISETNTLFKDIASEADKVSKIVGDQYAMMGDSLGGSFVAALAKQAEKATIFADRIKTLTAMGLSPENILQVLQSGVDAGTRIADALIRGGQDAIDQSNAIQKSMQDMADALSAQLGDKFYATGISLGEAIVKGLQEELERINELIKDADLEKLKKILAGQQGTVDAIVNGTDYSGNGGVGIAEANAVSKGLLTQEQADALVMRRYSPSYAYAQGGIAMTPQIATIGENGPEMVLPLNKLSALGGTTINLTVNADSETNGKLVGDAIVNELVRWQRRNGKVPITTN
jgi:hypothetical protein